MPIERSTVIHSQRKAWDVWLKSARWPGATVAIHVWSVSEENDEPEVKKAIERRGTGAAALVSVYAYVGW
ncbi:hypothetical protein AB0K12_42660 [Nonomuraea sp. NPDC049419]|uniref:hypothetical protein n=1 Tax=Nonomuraea sp. NPDC049419 TaxID=3155772 RepID=UPI00344A909C